MIYAYIAFGVILVSGVGIAAIAGRRGAEVERLQARIEHLERVRAILERRIENLLSAKRR